MNLEREAGFEPATIWLEGKRLETVWPLPIDRKEGLGVGCNDRLARVREAFVCPLSALRNVISGLSEMSSVAEVLRQRPYAPTSRFHATRTGRKPDVLLPEDRVDIIRAMEDMKVLSYERLGLGVEMSLRGGTTKPGSMFWTIAGPSTSCMTSVTRGKDSGILDEVAADGRLGPGTQAHGGLK